MNDADKTELEMMRDRMAPHLDTTLVEGEICLPWIVHYSTLGYNKVRPIALWQIGYVRYAIIL